MPAIERYKNLSGRSIALSNNAMYRAIKTTPIGLGVMIDCSPANLRNSPIITTPVGLKARYSHAFIPNAA